MGSSAESVREWRNWTGDERCRPAAFERPASIEECSAAIACAAEHSQRVRVVGAGHSFNDIACIDGRLLALERMTRVLDIDRSSRLVRVQGASRSASSHATSPGMGSHRRTSATSTCKASPG
jgi:FAD/FMN-containing dehydrogenase